MSYSQFERGKYIRLKILHLILLDMVSPERFGRTWDLLDKMNPDGTTHCEELIEDEYYKKALDEWKKAKKAQRQRFVNSKSM